MGHQHASVREGTVLEKCVQAHSVREQAGNRSGLGLQPLASCTLSRRGERRGKIITPKLHGSYNHLIYEIQHLLASVSLTPPLLQGHA